jgi:hypothetical protein
VVEVCVCVTNLPRDLRRPSALARVRACARASENTRESTHRKKRKKTIITHEHKTKRYWSLLEREGKGEGEV